MREPKRNEDGFCVECLGRGLCDYHKIETQARWMEKQNAMRLAARGIRSGHIARIMARGEMESDEAGTAYEKAERIFDGNNPIPQHLMISGA